MKIVFLHEFFYIIPTYRLNPLSSTNTFFLSAKYRLKKNILQSFSYAIKDLHHQIDQYNRGSFLCKFLNFQDVSQLKKLKIFMPITSLNSFLSSFKANFDYAILNSTYLLIYSVSLIFVPPLTLKTVFHSVNL